MLRAGLTATDQFNSASSMVETLASQREDDSYILGELGSRAGVLNDSDALGYANVGGGSVDALKRTVETFSDVKDTITSSRSTRGNLLSAATDISSYGSDLSGDLKNIVSPFVSESGPIPDQLEQAGNSLRIIAGFGQSAQAAIEGHNATSDRYSAERAGRRLHEEAAQRAQSGDQAKLENDKLLRTMATGARNAAKVRKAESVQKGVNGGFEMMNGALSFIPGYGNLAAAGGSAVQKAVNVGTGAQVEQESKQAREANLANLQLRRSFEQKLGMRDDLSEKEKNEIRHRAKHLANQFTTGERGATTNKVAGMHKTQGDVAALGELTAQDVSEGHRAREIANMMGIGTNQSGQLISADSAAA